MTRQELLDMIDESIRTEETATRIYLRHLDAIVTRGGFSPSRVARAKKIIELLVEGNSRHLKILLTLKQRIATESTNVY